MQHTDDVLYNFTLETCVILLTNATPIDLIRKKAETTQKKELLAIL